MAEQIKRTRTTNFTNEEKLNLLRIIKKYKQIENKESGVQSWKTKEDAWKAVESEFNSNSSMFRTSDVLKRFYNNKKKETRKYAAHLKNEMNRTGGGEPIKVKDNPVYNLTLDIINTKTVFGLVNKFDGDSDMHMQPSCSSQINTQAQEVQETEINDFYEGQGNGETENEVIVLEVEEGESLLEMNKENVSEEQYSLQTPKLLSNKLKGSANWKSRRRPQLSKTASVTLKYEEVADVKKEVMLIQVQFLKMQQAELEEKSQWEKKQRHLQENREVEEFELKRKALLLDIQIKEAQLAALGSVNRLNLK